MATSGRINGTAMASGVAVPGRYAFWIDWTRNSYSIENNSSNITLYMRIQRIDGAYDGAWALDVKPSVSLSVGGPAKTPSISYIDTRNKVVCTFATWTGDVKHNPDGTPNCPIVASFTHYGSSSLSGGTLSGSADLDTIPQATSLDSVSCSTNYFTGAMTTRYTPKASTLYNHLNISLNLSGSLVHVLDIPIGQKPASQQPLTTTLGSSELTTIYNRLTTEPAKGVLRFTFRTYSDAAYSKQVGAAQIADITLYVPDEKDTQPTVGMALSPVSSLPSAFDGLYIQGKTKVKATLEVDGKYGATLRSRSVIVEGKSYSGSGNVYTSDYLNHYGSADIYAYVNDSRNFTGSASQRINVIAYSKPKIIPASDEKLVIAARCDSSGNLNDGGTYLKIKAKCDYAQVAQKNSCSIRYRWKPEKGEYGGWTTIASGLAIGDEVSTGALLDGALDKDTTYFVQVGVVDTIGEQNYTTITVPTEKVYCHRDGARRSYTFGGYVEEDNTFAIASDIALKPLGGIARVAMYDGNDFNDLIRVTGYYCSGSKPSHVGCVNYPEDRTGVLEVISQMYQHDTGEWWGFAWQTYRTYLGDVYMRSYFNEQGWTAWKKLTMT